MNSGDTYRAVYTVKIAEKVYVLHCFQKKSTKGIETPKHEMDLIRERLKAVFMITLRDCCQTLPAGDNA